MGRTDRTDRKATAHRGKHTASAEEPWGFARMTPAQRKASARLGAYTLAATHDMAAIAAKARRGLWESYLRKADPDGVLSDAERTRRAEALQKAHYARMSLARWGRAS